MWAVYFGELLIDHVVFGHQDSRAGDCSARVWRVMVSARSLDPCRYPPLRSAPLCCNPNTTQGTLGVDRYPDRFRQIGGKSGTPCPFRMTGLNQRRSRPPVARRRHVGAPDVLSQLEPIARASAYRARPHHRVRPWPPACSRLHRWWHSEPAIAHTPSRDQVVQNRSIRLHCHPDQNTATTLQFGRGTIAGERRLVSGRAVRRRWSLRQGGCGGRPPISSTSCFPR